MSNATSSFEMILGVSPSIWRTVKSEATKKTPRSHSIEPPATAHGPSNPTSSAVWRWNGNGEVATSTQTSIDCVDISSSTACIALARRSLSATYSVLPKEPSGMFGVLQVAGGEIAVGVREDEVAGKVFDAVGLAVRGSGCRTGSG